MDNRVRLLLQLLQRLNPHLSQAYRKTLLKIIKMTLRTSSKELSGLGSKSAILKDYLKVKKKLGIGSGKIDPEKFVDRVMRTLQKKKK